MANFNWKKKRWRLYQGRIDHNSHHNRNILRTKSGKRKTSKGVPGCHGYHETSWWNSGWCPCQGLCSLQTMDQGVIQQQNFMAHRGNKITQHQMRIHSKGCAMVVAWPPKQSLLISFFLAILMPGFQLMFMLLYFSIVKIPLGSVTLRWATESSRLNK